MKAAVYSRYGPPDVIQIVDVEPPVPLDDEVLIRVHAASVNPYDSHLMQGTPYLGRLAFGIRNPRQTRPGVDVAGVVEAIGPNVTQFATGDSVFGFCRASLAEYACARQSSLVRKPANVTFDQAAAAPLAAVTALQGLRDAGRFAQGEQVLVNGAAGGIGTFAVQIARASGARVAGVCSTRNVEMVRALGAERVIDYTRDDFTGGPERYDLILDCVSTRPLSACRRALTKKGRYVMVGAPDTPWMLGFLARLVAAPIVSWFTSQTLLAFMTKPDQSDLAEIARLLESGKVAPVVERRYTLDQTAEAFRHLQTGHARGKLVVALRP